MEDNTKNITGKGQIDRDILQCKADILQAWKSSKPAKSQPPFSPDPAVDISEITPKTEPPKKTEPLRPVAEERQPAHEAISKPEDSLENLENLQAELESAKSHPQTENDPEPTTADEIEEIEFDNINADVQTDIEIDEKIADHLPSRMDVIETDEKIEETLQTEADQDDSSGIPRFNLAEQILSAQRKAASTRRQRPAGNGNNAAANIAPAEGTIGKIISESKKTVPDEPIELYQAAESPEPPMSQTPEPDEPIELYEAVEPDEPYFSMGPGCPDPAAAQIISEIVADDLQRLCGKYTVARQR